MPGSFRGSPPKRNSEFDKRPPAVPSLAIGGRRPSIDQDPSGDLSTRISNAGPETLLASS